MDVHLVAHTVVRPMIAPAISDTPFGARARNDYVSGEATDADIVAEFAGRACYQSWKLPNEKTATNDDYLKNILAQAHYSVLEHASFTVYVTGVSRSLTHELVRHRHLSYSQLSQRFIDESDADFVVPPAVAAGNPDLAAALARVWTAAQEEYAGIADGLLDAGYTRKQAREAARCVLPNMTETRIVVSGNIRAWREFVQKRYNPHADAEIQEFARQILLLMRVIAPASVQDIPLRADDTE